jgi:hypothetical protein
MNKNRMRGVSVGRAGVLSRSPYPSSMQNVDPAVVRGRRLKLPREICPVSRKRLSVPRGVLSAGQKSAEGIVGSAVGEASEALQSREAEQQIGQTGNENAKAGTRRSGQ